MPSPDFKRYIDLTINDAQPSEIYDQAVEYAATALPEFRSRTGTVEDALLQAMSYVAGLTTGAINRLPNGLMEGLLRLWGFERLEAEFASGSVVFTLNDTTGFTVPVGTRVGYTEITDSETIQHVFATVEPGLIPVGQATSQPVKIVALETGLKPPVSDGTQILLLSPSNRIFSVNFSGSLTQGAESESDESYFSRGATYLASLSQGLATASQINNFVLTESDAVGRSLTLDLRKVNDVQGLQIFESFGSLGASLTVDPLTVSPIPTAGGMVKILGSSENKFNKEYEITNVTGNTDPFVVYFSNTAGASSGETFTGDFTVRFLESLETSAVDQPGFITTVVANTQGNDVTQQTLDFVEGIVSESIVGGLNYRVVNPLRVNLEILINIYVLPDYDNLIVRQAVDDAVTEYASPSGWQWGNVLRKNAVLTRASNVEGVDYVDSVTISISSEQDGILASLDSVTGDVVFIHEGTLPVSSVTVGSL